MSEDKMKEDKELVTLLTFLKDTRDGKYCKVEKKVYILSKSRIL